MRLTPGSDAKGGFSGDVTVGEGRYVCNGPFANFEAQYFGDKAMPHRFLCGFASDAHLLRIGEPVSPDALDVLRQNATISAEYAPELE